MADNSAQNGTDTIATDDIGGVKHQRVKVEYGADGSATDVSTTTPLPVTSVDLSVSGTISATDAVVGVHAGSLLSGTPTASSYVALALGWGESVFVVQITGTLGGGTYWFECSADSTNGINGNWTSLSMRFLASAGTVLGDSTTIAGLFRGTAAGMAYVRVRTTGATAPSAAVVIRGSESEGPTALNAALPTGTNVIGTVSAKGVALTPVSGNVAAAATGTIGPMTVTDAGNVTFTIKNQVAANAWAGAPVIVFEQSDDSTSWAPLQVVRGDTGAVATTFTLPAGAANTELMFDAAAEAISYVRARVTTGPTTNPITVAISAGGMPFSPVVTTVDRKDANRVNFAANYTSTAPVVADTLLTLAMNKGSTNSSVTTVPVTAGKTLRITAVILNLRATVATLPYGLATLRVNYSGAAVIGSTGWALVAVSGSAAVIGNTGTVVMSPEGGFADLAGAAQFGLSFSNNLVSNVANITVVGYEF